jgi:hypothetical protein
MSADCVDPSPPFRLQLDYGPQSTQRIQRDGERVRLRSEGIATQRLGDEAVLLDLRSSEYLSVSGVGVDIIELLDTDRTEGELVEALLTRYDVDVQTLREDIASFLQALRDAGLLE